MLLRSVERRYIIVFLSVCIGLLVGVQIRSLAFTTPENFTVLKADGDFLDIEPECVDTPEFLGGVKSKMCILPGETFSENGLKSSGVFDGDMVNRVLKALMVYKDATLIDCGANIGMVTTVVAAMGRKVISVDPMKEHLSYIRKSLGLLGNQDNVMLLNNAVSNEPGKLYPHTPDIHNKAAIKMYTEQEIKNMNVQPTGPAVKVITMMDILALVKTPTVILKVDVESFECRAVTRDVAMGKSGHFIPVIMMEWTLLQEQPEYSSCVGWLFEAGYTPYNIEQFAKLSKEEVLKFTSWYGGGPFTHDLIWIHSKANPDVLNL